MLVMWMLLVAVTIQFVDGYYDISYIPEPNLISENEVVYAVQLFAAGLGEIYPLSGDFSENMEQITKIYYPYLIPYVKIGRIFIETAESITYAITQLLEHLFTTKNWGSEDSLQYIQCLAEGIAYLITEQFNLYIRIAEELSTILQMPIESTLELLKCANSDCAQQIITVATENASLLNFTAGMLMKSGENCNRWFWTGISTCAAQFRPQSMATQSATPLESFSLRRKRSINSAQEALSTGATTAKTDTSSTPFHHSTIKPLQASSYPTTPIYPATKPPSTPQPYTSPSHQGSPSPQVASTPPSPTLSGYSSTRTPANISTPQPYTSSSHQGASSPPVVSTPSSSTSWGYSTQTTVSTSTPSIYPSHHGASSLPAMSTPPSPTSSSYAGTASPRTYSTSSYHTATTNRPYTSWSTTTASSYPGIKSYSSSPLSTPPSPTYSSHTGTASPRTYSTSSYNTATTTRPYTSWRTTTTPSYLGIKSSSSSPLSNTSSNPTKVSFVNGTATPFPTTTTTECPRKTPKPRRRPMMPKPKHGQPPSTISEEPPRRHHRFTTFGPTNNSPYGSPPFWAGRNGERRGDSKTSDSEKMQSSDGYSKGHQRWMPNHFEERGPKPRRGGKHMKPKPKNTTPKQNSSEEDSQSREF